MNRRLCALLFLVFSVLFLTPRSAKAQQQFTVIHDTVLINAADYFDPISTIQMKWSTPYRDWYFCVFEERDVFEFWIDKKVFLAISKDGKTIRRVDCPNNFKRSSYGDLYVWHDTLFLHTYYSSNSPFGYYFDLDQWEWKPVEHISDFIYEDELYQVAFVDVGEWGEYIWFVEKQGESSGKQYVRPSRLPRILKSENSYFFIYPNQINTTPINGVKGALCDYSMVYNPANKNKGDYYQLDSKFYYPKYNENGIKVDTFPVYFRFTGKKTTSYSWGDDDYATRYDTLIEQAFRLKDQNYYIVTAPQKTVIAQPKNGSMRTVCDLGLHCDFFSWTGAYRGTNLADNHCFLQFKKDFYTYGMMDVKDSTVFIRYLKHNQDTLPIMGTDNIQPLLKFLLNHLDSLSLEDLSRQESQLGGTGNHLFRRPNGFFPKEYQNEVDYGSTSFYKIVSKKQTLITSYCVHKSDSAVKGVYLEWVKTNFFNASIFSSEQCENVAAKCKEVSAIVTRLTGHQPEQLKNHQKWTYKGLTIELYNNGRMVIY